jgi:hypothetical protein
MVVTSHPKSGTLDQFHKHRYREKIRNGIMLALAVVLVILNIWVYFSK